MKTYTEKNVNALVDFFINGCKKETLLMLGVEVEHFVVNKKTKETISYYGENGINKILFELSEFYKEKTYINNNLIGLSKAKAVITIEPAAQLEISIGPYENIADIEKEYEYFLSKLNPILEKYDYELINLGYHPKSKVDDLKLIPKKRYEIMDEHFNKTGKHGKNMMKGSCATQVSIDYTSENDFIKKFRLANILSPIFYFLCDNSPVFEGDVYEFNMLRASIWKDMDNDRSKVVNDALNKKFGFKEYAEYIYNSPVIINMDESGNLSYSGFTPISDIYKYKSLTDETIRHVLSMFFPDNRLKTYIEIRMADSMPKEYILAYTATVKGIFYNDYAVNTLLSKFSFVDNKNEEDAIDELIKYGFDSRVYSMNILEIINEIFVLAESGLSDEERIYLKPFKKLMESKNTLAQIEKNKLLINPIVIKHDEGKMI